MNRRVVVTGMGVVSAVGNDLTAFQRGLREGLSGEGPILSFDASGFPVKRAYEVRNFDPPDKTTHRMDPFIRYAVAATAEALTQAAFDPSKADPYRVGISVSSSKGGVRTLHRFSGRFEKNPSPLLGARLYTNSLPNFAAQWIARRWRIQGPAKCYVAACATGTVAVMEGARMVGEGVVDYCIAGASDASLVPLMLAGYRKMKVLASDGMRPFDLRRSGFLVGEGAGIVFLETLESATARGARIFGEILGSAYGSYSSDAIHFRSDGDHALEHTLRLALRSAGLRAEEVDYINLHGTGTQTGDLYETQEIKRAFGRDAYRIPMSSIKAMTGHMLGASGAVEIIASLVAMEDGFIPPTLGLEKEDPACDLDYTPRKSKAAVVHRALSISMGFGGHVAVIALGGAP